MAKEFIHERLQVMSFGGLYTHQQHFLAPMELLVHVPVPVFLCRLLSNVATATRQYPLLRMQNGSSQKHTRNSRRFSILEPFEPQEAFTSAFMGRFFIFQHFHFYHGANLRGRSATTSQQDRISATPTFSF
jgi:hypothetical protein